MKHLKKALKWGISVVFISTFGPDDRNSTVMDYSLNSYQHFNAVNSILDCITREMSVSSAFPSIG